MWTQLQGAVVAVLEEGGAVDTKEFFCLFDRDPSVGFGHDVEKRVPQYGIEPDRPVKVLNGYFPFLSWFYTNEAKLK